MGLRVRRALVLEEEAVGSELVTDANQKTAAASAFDSFFGGGSLRHRHVPPSPFSHLMNDRRRGSARLPQTGSENGA